jgi:DNA-binding MarR family transcriptional regulator
MSTPKKRGARHKASDLDDAVRDLLLLTPRIVGKTKRMTPPPELRSTQLGPRHLSLLGYLLFDGPMTVNELADRLQVAPTTASLMIAELSRAGVLERVEDENDRRRRIVSISDAKRPTIQKWLGPAADAWGGALADLTPAERRTVVDTLRRYLELVGE